MKNTYLGVVVVGFTVVAGFAAPLAAQVAYARPSPLDPFFSPYDESYGTSPSFQIHPRAYGQAPAVQVVERCQYPDGWNVTDFGRDVNGTPNGLDHACPVTPERAIRARR